MRKSAISRRPLIAHHYGVTIPADFRGRLVTIQNGVAELEFYLRLKDLTAEDLTAIQCATRIDPELAFSALAKTDSNGEPRMRFSASAPVYDIKPSKKAWIS